MIGKGYVATPGRRSKGYPRMSGREVVSLTLDRLADLPDPCAGCIFWEVAPALTARSVADGSSLLDKEAWLSSVLLEWGSVGKVVYVDGRAAGYVTYAPPHLVPRSQAFATTPVSADAMLLITARVPPEFAGQGLGRLLVQSAAKDLLRRGVRAIEAFARTAPDPQVLPSNRCLLPAEFLMAVGFKTVRPHPAYPRLRLDLRSVLSLREDVEQAVERLLSTVRTPALGRGQRLEPLRRWGRYE